MGGGEGKSMKRRSSPFSGEEEGRERRRRDKESRRNSRDDREEEDDDRHKKRKNGKHSDRDKGKERDSKDRHSKEKEKSKRKEKDTSSSNGGQPCSQFKAWPLAHKGKATSDVDYNLEDPPSAYNNATVHNPLSEYTSMVRAVNEPEYDLSTQHLNGEVVMRVGGDKKHVRFSIGDDTLDTATTPTLSQIRARSTSTGPAIRPQLDTTHYQIEAIQAQLKEMKRQREEMEAMHEARRQWMEQTFQWMQSIGEKIGLPLSSVPFHPRPPATTPNSAESNNGPH